MQIGATACRETLLATPSLSVNAPPCSPSPAAREATGSAVTIYPRSEPPSLLDLCSSDCAQGLRPKSLESLGLRTYFGRRTILGVPALRDVTVVRGETPSDGRVADSHGILLPLPTSTLRHAASADPRQAPPTANCVGKQQQAGGGGPQPGRPVLPLNRLSCLRIHSAHRSAEQWRDARPAGSCLYALQGPVGLGRRPPHAQASRPDLCWACPELPLVSLPWLSRLSRNAPS